LTPRIHIATTLSGLALRFEAVWWTTMPTGFSGRPVFTLPGASTSFITWSAQQFLRRSNQAL